VILAMSLMVAPFAQAHAQTIGEASYYHPDRVGLLAAHRTLPLGAHVRVINLANGRETTVVIVGRGPFTHRRIIDVSTSAADVLGFRQAGVARVKIEVVDR
jgi:rare lipoprotein A